LVISRQVFVRRILQVCAELQDAREVLLTACAPRLTARQLELTTQVDESDADDSATFSDPSLDPSVRFFGLDWHQLFSRCHSLSVNVRVLASQLVRLAGSDAGAGVDLVLLNAVLRDLWRVEVDVTSHGEAVLHGRLSKSQQLLIRQEQNRLSQVGQQQQQKVAKSRSFRDTTGEKKAKAGKQFYRYKKNKTTDFSKLSVSSVAPSLSAASSACASGNIGGSYSRLLDSDPQALQARTVAEWHEVMAKETGKRKNSFIHNVSSLFKNIR
jgi:hypothetical protein